MQTADLYFMRNTFHGCIKIGRSTNVEARRAAFQTAGPGRLEVLAVVEAGGDLEADLHSAFDFERVGGEWFVAGGAAETFARAWAIHPDRHPPEGASPLLRLAHVLQNVGEILSAIGSAWVGRALKMDDMGLLSSAAQINSAAQADLYVSDSLRTLDSYDLTGV